MNKKELFLNTLNGVVYKKKPVWFMRQAGRFLESYRLLRNRYDFLTMCTTPELASKVTLLPLKELDIDAMILFSDILIPLMALGAKLVYKDGISPIADDLNLEDLSYNPDNIEELLFVAQTVKIIKEEYNDVPLIGFAAAPFTLACYMFGSGGDFYRVRSFIYKKPKSFLRIMDILTDLTIDYLNLQIKAGVDVIQLFDSWGGLLPADVYETFSFPFNNKIAEQLSVPSIYYIKNSAHIHSSIINMSCSCLSVDWRENLSDLHKKSSKCMQGNLDNTLLLSDKNTIKAYALKLLEETRDMPHIFNLGHGILPQTKEDMAKFLVDIVHDN